MIDFVEYRFRIIGPSPETLPMGRLAAYMAELARLLGSEEKIHFDRIENRSVGVVARVPPEEIATVSPRVRAAAHNDEQADAAVPFRQLNKLLGEDGWKAELPLPQCGEVIQFPGTSRNEKALKRVQQPTTIRGRLIRIEGSGDVVKIGLEIDGRLSARVSFPAASVQDLARHFHHHVSVTGDGRWKRDDDGQWSLEDLKAVSFEPLDDSPLSTVLDRLRNLMPAGEGTKIIKAVDELRH